MIALVALLCAVAPEPEFAHPPPTAHLEVHIGKDRVTSRVTAELPVWNTWLGLDISSEFMLAEDQINAIGQGAVELFRTHNPISIEGRAVAPRLAGAEASPDYTGTPSVTVELHYACDGEPRRIAFKWDTFEATDLFEEQAVPMMLKATHLLEQPIFTLAEPEYIWHARNAPPPERPKVEAVGGPPPLHLLLPGASIGLLAIALALWPVAAHLRVSRRGRWIATAALALGAFAARDLWTIAMPSPFGGIAVPSEREAATIFERLHGNIYRAFGADTEQEIYDLLAVSVAPDLLDELYADVYESLILRGQGGAVCSIERIERDATAVEIAADDAELPHFAVDCTWRVFGVVSHWGHQHRRLNRYRARYTVAHDGRSWRIAGVDLLDHTREDDG